MVKWLSFKWLRFMCAKYETRTMSVLVNKEGADSFEATAMLVAIVDETAGEFVEVTSQITGYDKIAIDPEEWPVLREAINRMVGECRG